MILNERSAYFDPKKLHAKTCVCKKVNIENVAALHFPRLVDDSAHAAVINWGPEVVNL
jgi:hypothetical protein